MPERRHIRVSRSLEGEGERPARRYGVTPSRRIPPAPNAGSYRQPREPQYAPQGPRTGWTPNWTVSLGWFGVGSIAPPEPGTAPGPG